METQLKKLNRILRFTSLNPNMFYSIRVDKYDINFQGYFTSGMETILRQKFTYEFNGNIVFKRGNITIVLTPKGL